MWRRRADAGRDDAVIDLRERLAPYGGEVAVAPEALMPEPAGDADPPSDEGYRPRHLVRR